MKPFESNTPSAKTPDNTLVEASRQKAIEAANRFTIDNANYNEELDSIIRSNSELLQGWFKYDGSKTFDALSDFTFLPWGNGSHDKSRLDEIADLVKIVGGKYVNDAKYPDAETLNNIFTEWATRTSEIKAKLRVFAGDKDEAFKLFEDLQKEKVLQPLNDDKSPLMVAIN